MSSLSSKLFFAPVLSILGALATVGTGHAQEVRVGVGYSGPDLVIKNAHGPEQGNSITAEYIFASPRPLRFIGSPRPYVGVLASLNGYTDFAQTGVMWRLQHDRFYLDFGGGGAIHNGHLSLPAPQVGLPDAVNTARRLIRDERVEFGSRVLFHATLAAGFRLNDRWAVEVGAQHWSNGHVHSPTNDGTDIASVRVAYRL